MGILSGPINEREKAALNYHIFGGCNDWQVLYMIARDSDYNEDKDKNFTNYVSRWKHTEKVQNYLKELQERKALQEYRLKESAFAEYQSRETEKDQREGKEHTENGRKTQIDYTRPENQRTLLNNLINTADDQKDKLDALKTIIQAQKDDRQAAKDNQIQRFYSPLRCSSCPLYQKANKNLTI